VNLVVAELPWPRGATGRFRWALAALYRADAGCLDAAFGYLLGDRCASTWSSPSCASSSKTKIPVLDQ
jgi:hypothetical protein